MAISALESIRVGLNDIAMRKVRSIITIFGIVLGVMCIMVVLAILAGMNQTTMSWMQEQGGLNKVTISINWHYDFKKGGEASFDLIELHTLRSLIPEAKAFNASAGLWDASLGYKDKSYGSYCIGVYPDMQIVDNWYPEKGRFINEHDIRESNNVMVLGTSVAEQLFGRQNPIGKKIKMKGHIFEVIGVLSKKYWEQPGGGGMWGDNALEYMNQRCFIPISTMMIKVSPKSRVDNIEVLADSPEAALALQKRLRPIVWQMKNGKKLFQVSSAKESMDDMKQATRIFSAVFIMIAAISLLVGGIVIMNIMLASIKERTREIGVRLAIGARRWDIFTQFLVQTILITALGGVFGLIFGYLILDLVGKYLKMPMVANPSMIYTALAVSVGIGLIFGIAPAARAGNLDPVVALREE